LEVADRPHGIAVCRDSATTLKVDQGMLCAMKALYDNRIYNVVDVVLDIILEGHDGKQFSVELWDERLIVDPTDSEVAEASNLAEWYGVDDERATQLRLMLLGEISLEQWQSWKEHRANS
jgi:hypothetical protein